MKHRKYWAKRLRLFGDAVSGAVAALAAASTGLASGEFVIGNITFAAVGLLVALILWISTSFISAEMDDGNS